MSYQKLGGSMRYEDLGPGVPNSHHHYTVGGRSVHDVAASSGLNKGTAQVMRPPSRNGAYIAQPFVIKRDRSTPVVIPE